MQGKGYEEELKRTYTRDSGPGFGAHEVMALPAATDRLLLGSDVPDKPPRSAADVARRQRVLLAVFVVAAVAIPLAVVLSTSTSHTATPSAAAFSAQVVAGRAARVMAHLKALDSLPGTSRAVGTEGYVGSAEYVEGLLNTSGLFHVERQWFTAPVWAEVEPPALELLTPLAVSFVAGVDIASIRYGGETGDVTGEVVRAGFGCADADFGGAPNGKVALVLDLDPTGIANCSLYDKVGACVRSV